MSRQRGFWADLAVLFFRKALSPSLRCGASCIVEIPPSIWECAAPRVQVKSQDGEAAVTAGTSERSPECLLFPLPDRTVSPFSSVHLMGLESKLLCLEMSGWPLWEPGMNATCCRSWHVAARGSVACFPLHGPQVTLILEREAVALPRYQKCLYCFSLQSLGQSLPG